MASGSPRRDAPGISTPSRRADYSEFPSRSSDSELMQ
jgi:hypothetical protein